MTGGHAWLAAPRAGRLCLAADDVIAAAGARIPAVESGTGPLVATKPPRPLEMGRLAGWPSLAAELRGGCCGC